MATNRKPPKEPAAAKASDEDDEVLFEGELTWTHDPVPMSPEILQRTPRTDEPKAKGKHGQPPSEGSIEIQELGEGGGEIFHNEKSVAATHADESDEPDAFEEDLSGTDKTDTTDQAAPPEPIEVPAADQPVAVKAAKRAPSSGPHGKTVMPLNGFSKAKAGDGVDPFAADQAGRRTGAGSPNGPVAGEFALPDDPEGSHPHRLKFILAGIVGLLLLIVGGVVAYMVTVVPNRPDAVIAQSMANTLKQQSAQFVLSVADQATDKRTIMEFGAAGGISQVGSFDIATRLRNESTPTPLIMTARSIDGIDSYVQGGALAANQAYLTKLGVPPAATVPNGALQQLEGRWVRIPGDIRQEIFKSIGFDPLASMGFGSADKQKLASIYAKYPFLTVAEELPDATIDGVVNHHYRLDINKTQLTAFSIAAKDQVKTLGITQTQIDAANKLDSGKLRVEVWLSRDSRLLTQVAVTKQKPTGSLVMQLKMSRYNETLALQQPTGQVEALAALRSLIGPAATDADAMALLRKIAGNYTTAGR